MLSLNYDQPAQKAPVTLKRILDMLRDCFRCYWFVDDQNRFRIEHIKYFMNGGAYTGTPVIGRDLTTEQITRSGKKWAFGTSKFQFDKPEMTARYQFGWMDDVTQPFNGNPIDIVSKYVNPDKIEQIDISQFTSDIDYILLNPGEISKDGFALLAATENVLMSTLEFEQGSLSSQGGFFNDLKISTTIRIRTKDLHVILNKNMQISIQSGFMVALEFYNDNQYWVGSTGWLTGTQNVVAGASAYYVALVVAKTDNTTITTSTSFNGTIAGIRYKLPYLQLSLNEQLQNGWAAFVFLQQYYFYDMPAEYFRYNGVLVSAYGIKKLKTQTLKFPALNDPNTLQLIKTGLGNGTIQKMSVNLSSRNANTTLKYDTE